MKLHFKELIYHMTVVSLFALISSFVALYSASIYILVVYCFVFDCISLLRTYLRSFVYSHQNAQTKNKLVLIETFSLIMVKVNNSNNDQTALSFPFKLT